MLCAAVTAACAGGVNSPVSPSAVVGSVSALNADGSNLKVTAPLAISPLFEITNVTVTPVLAARASQAVHQPATTLSHRFQVADSESFANILASGMGTTDASGVVRYTVDPALPPARRVVWRLRAELGDAFGPWSNVMAFTTAGPTQVTVPTTTPTSSGPRTPDPAPGTRLPLPNMFPTLQQFADTRDSCPRGIQYVNNPWQDRVIDAFRLVDTRWGYNGKPTRTAAQNGGFPVVAAGDEAAYHWGAGPDQGSPDVHLVDMLVSHCGGSPTIGWRVFTGEEPGFWTGAGRF
ncbi:MAG TPA: hypothetical protein VEA16_17090 [Vicinamibacterales bacterium]|nr:hypothetical protein [Vicinamibacterales bacterium]